jgi:2-polyprenyl-3-methyl-5-hydroxy-6-metoxy-1,4-benzoquinol methylase
VNPQAVSSRRVVGPLISVVKRLVRKSIRWYVQPQIEELRQQVEELRQRMERVEPLQQRVARLESHLFARPHINPENVRVPPGPNAGETFDYVGFEYQFRGPRSRIQDILRFYVPYFRDRTVVLDLGCGRGEFLDVLGEVGGIATGVENHAGQAAECRRRGHQVIEADLFEHVNSLPDASIDGFFAGHVIEHLPFSVLVQLYHRAYRKLKPGGVFIAETVNPHCTAAFKFFYLDPTHVAPLFPEVMNFVAESSGFARTEILFPIPCDDPQHIYHDSCVYALLAEK